MFGGQQIQHQQLILHNQNMQHMNEQDSREYTSSSEQEEGEEEEEEEEETVDHR